MRPDGTLPSVSILEAGPRTTPTSCFHHRSKSSAVRQEQPPSLDMPERRPGREYVDTSQPPRACPAQTVQRGRSAGHGSCSIDGLSFFISFLKLIVTARSAFGYYLCVCYSRYGRSDERPTVGLSHTRSDSGACRLQPVVRRRHLIAHPHSRPGRRRSRTWELIK